MFELQIWRLQPPNNLLSCAAKDGIRVTGIQKLAGRFLNLLLTDRDSIRYCRPRQQPRGTLFMAQFRAGMYHTEADLMSAFDVATIMVRSQLNEEQDSDDPPDEQFKTAKLEKIVIEPGGIRLIISIHSLDSTLRVVLPLAAWGCSG